MQKPSHANRLTDRMQREEKPTEEMNQMRMDRCDD